MVFWEIKVILKLVIICFMDFILDSIEFIVFNL